MKTVVKYFVFFIFDCKKIVLVNLLLLLILTLLKKTTFLKNLFAYLEAWYTYITIVQLLQWHHWTWVIFSFHLTLACLATNTINGWLSSFDSSGLKVFVLKWKLTCLHAVTMFFRHLTDSATAQVAKYELFRYWNITQFIFWLCVPIIFRA